MNKEAAWGFSQYGYRIFPINCRGVLHTPENIHVDSLTHPGVCDTPLHGMFAEFIFRHSFLDCLR